MEDEEAGSRVLSMSERRRPVMLERVGEQRVEGLADSKASLSI